jgi:hypothetical protein
MTRNSCGVYGPAAEGVEESAWMAHPAGLDEEPVGLGAPQHLRDGHGERRRHGAAQAAPRHLAHRHAPVGRVGTTQPARGVQNLGPGADCFHPRFLYYVTSHDVWRAMSATLRPLPATSSKRMLNLRLSGYVASYDVASDICQALPAPLRRSPELRTR